MNYTKKNCMEKVEDSCVKGAQKLIDSTYCTPGRNKQY